jgi:hypothetical protein
VKNMRYIILPQNANELAPCQCGCNGMDCSCNSGARYKEM